MTQFSAVIRRTNGDEETSLVEAGSEARAREIAEEIAKAADGELVSVQETAATLPEEPSDV